MVRNSLFKERDQPLLGGMDGTLKAFSLQAIPLSIARIGQSPGKHIQNMTGKIDMRD
jgi:hypothetical protein